VDAVQHAFHVYNNLETGAVTGNSVANDHADVNAPYDEHNFGDEDIGGIGVHPDSEELEADGERMEGL
jgi:hypothetical protein